MVNETLIAADVCFARAMPGLGASPGRSRSSVVAEAPTLREAERHHQHVHALAIRRQRQDEGLKMDDSAIDDLPPSEIATRLPVFDDAGKVPPHARAIH